MRTKTLLFLLLLSCGVLNAQDTIKTLVITEARLDDARHSYVEITNMGTTAVNLSQFELGQIGAWTVAYQAGAGFWVMLPDRELAPGKSFVAAAVYDWNPKMWLKDPDHFSRILNKKEFWTLADLKFHFPESPVQPNALDSVTPHYHILETWNGRDCIYLRQHISATDSVVVDQVNGVFANADGTRGDPKGAIDVAGVTNATNEATLIRKFSVKKGNTDFETGRGQDAAESEWMPVPLQLGHWEMMRTLFWTVGNHGDYNLDPSTITSSTIDIGWADSTLVVPWGIRNDDSIMSEFVKKPGIAWHYAYAKNYADSAHISARTGDILTLYAAGNDLDMINFKITVADPTVDANMVMPMRVKNADGFYAGMGAMYMVSANKNGVMDTIQGDYRGIGYASRVDTLFKYLEKAPKATWEIVWVDGKIRTDLKSGDILKVTAENGDVKNYFIKVDNYRPSHNAYLSSITWPDIPEEYKGIFGWLGDTIPNFVPTKYDFKVQVPADVPGIPALVGKNEDVNGKNVVSRAKNLTGGPEDRTITFTSTAEDDTTIRTYNVLLEKEKNPADLQPWSGEPFISQLVWNEQWANTFMEIANPGNQVLDMSNYMICSGYNVTSPVTAITSYALPADWPERYRKYIPGYKWKDQAGWSTDPAIAVQDLNVNPLVQGGDVFVLGDIRGTGQSGYPWWASQQCDIDFGHNPWGDDPTTIDGDAALNQWNLGTWFLFRIDNDSVKLGLKPATDPNDFTLLDVFGSGDGTIPVIGGLQLQQINGYTRKPEIYTGKPEFKGSFGTDEATSEWIFRDRAYYDARNVGWPNDILFVADGLGSHFMNDVTIFKSTVSSNTLKISEGFTSPQTIRGVVTDTTVNGFFAYIIKADTGQTLSVKSATNGSIRALTDAVINGDTLIVKSADKKNITKYVVTVTDEGLSSDAVLTSADYTVEYQGETGSVKGFDYGTLLKTVVSKVTVPANATMTVIDAKGAYVPYKTLNFDTLYVDLKVNNQMFLDVVAENGVTRIVYQLMPNALETDAFVTSDVFEVDQEASLIDLVPDGIATGPLMNNLVPAPGATMMLFDKFGYDRMFGRVMKDDKLVVTAMDGETTRTYYLQMLGDISLSLAYVLSDVYAVNQLDYTIWGYFDESTSVADFIANLIPATGANVKVTDADGVENTGNLVMGDKLVVTSGNGVNTVTYDITFPTDINNQNQHSINVYPNPASDRVTISGLMSGNRIRVNNIMGVVVIDKTAQMDKEVLSLQGQRFGIYFITVSNADGVVGRYKLILK